MIYLIGLGIAALSTIIYLYVKKNSAEALNQNIDTKEKLNELGKDLSKNDGLLDAEEERRRLIEEEKNAKLNQGATVTDLINFFSNRK